MPRVERIDVAAYEIPTETPESDGTFAWHKTTLVLVTARGADHHGLGWTYADRAAAQLIRDELAQLVTGHELLDVARAWDAMHGAVRNLGQTGLASMAISAVDCALWDLKARVLDLPLARLLGAVRQRVPIYGSGGFTSYDEAQLTRQLGGWAAEGIPRVKMKVGRAPKEDPGRVAAARRAIGPQVELFVDANGAYGRKQALAMAEVFARDDVSWFEEPVVAQDLDGLRLLRDRAPAGMRIAAGEYGFGLSDFRALLDRGAVDVLQADVTRCGGLTGLLRVGALCEAARIPLSGHCAPTEHLAAGCALPALVHLEYFHDHARIEQLLFDGAPRPHDGCLSPDPSRPGLGVELKTADAERYRS